MRDRILDRPGPLETEIAVAGLHREPRHLRGMEAWPMQVELRGAEAIGPAGRALHQLGAEHAAVERIGALPVRNMHDAMVKCDRKRHRSSPEPWVEWDKMIPATREVNGWSTARSSNW